MSPPLLNLRQEVSQVSVPGEDCRMRSKGSENLREAGLESRAGHRSLTVTVPQTPLHLAVITTLPSVVRLLVTAGASPMALDRHGQTAAHLACEHRSPTCLRALLDSAAPGTLDLEARNYDGKYLPRGTAGLSSGPGVHQRPQSPRPRFHQAFPSLRAHRPARGSEHRVPRNRAALTGARCRHRRSGERSLGAGREPGLSRGGVLSGAGPVSGWRGRAPAWGGAWSVRPKREAGPHEWDAVGMRVASCWSRAWKNSKTFPPRRRTLRAAAPRSSTPWKTTALAWCSCCCRCVQRPLSLAPTLSSDPNPLWPQPLPLTPPSSSGSCSCSASSSHPSFKA